MLFQGFAMTVQQRKEGVGHVCTLVAFLCNSSVEVTPECRNELLLNSSDIIFTAVALDVACHCYRYLQTDFVALIWGSHVSS